MWFTRWILFKNTLKNSIETHKNFIDANSESFKIILKLLHITLVSKSSALVSQIYKRNLIYMCYVKVEFHFKLVVHLNEGI
jgi:hypothetical protein